MENHNSDYATFSQSESLSWATHTKKKFGKHQDEHAMQFTTSVTALSFTPRIKSLSFDILIKALTELQG
jgi:hypothetical protein